MQGYSKELTYLMKVFILEETLHKLIEHKWVPWLPINSLIGLVNQFWLVTLLYDNKKKLNYSGWSFIMVSMTALFSRNSIILWYILLICRDYATTGGLWRMTRNHLRTTRTFDDSIYDDISYAVYIDLESSYSSGVGRYFSGILLEQNHSSLKNTLLERNNQSLLTIHSLWS